MELISFEKDGLRFNRVDSEDQHYKFIPFEIGDHFYYEIKRETEKMVSEEIVLIHLWRTGLDVFQMSGFAFELKSVRNGFRGILNARERNVPREEWRIIQNIATKKDLEFIFSNDYKLCSKDDINFSLASFYSSRYQIYGQKEYMSKGAKTEKAILEVSIIINHISKLIFQ